MGTTLIGRPRRVRLSSCFARTRSNRTVRPASQPRRGATIDRAPPSLRMKDCPLATVDRQPHYSDRSLCPMLQGRARGFTVIAPVPIVRLAGVTKHKRVRRVDGASRCRGRSTRDHYSQTGRSLDPGAQPLLDGAIDRCNWPSRQSTRPSARSRPDPPRTPIDDEPRPAASWASVSRRLQHGHVEHGGRERSQTHARRQTPDALPGAMGGHGDGAYSSAAV